MRDAVADGDATEDDQRGDLDDVHRYVYSGRSVDAAGGDVRDAEGERDAEEHHE